jgi:hypothetical protein
MKLQMDETTFLGFYKSTILRHSKAMQRQICELLVHEKLILSFVI